MKPVFWHLIILLFLIQAVLGMEVKIERLSGDVKVRRGVEETWQPAAPGMVLREIDTILSGEAGEVVLRINKGLTFRLGANAILDISDLRKITERELFLYLTRQKINRIDKRDEKTKLRIGNVSVVHGESKDSLYQGHDTAEPDLWEHEKNGAKALLDQEYYPNTIIKLHKILTRYPDTSDCGELHCYLGQSFEALNKPGQAIDAYQTVLKDTQESGCTKEKWQEIAREALTRLKE